MLVCEEILRRRLHPLSTDNGCSNKHCSVRPSSVCLGYIGWTQYFKNEDSNTIIFYNQDFYDANIKLTENLVEKYLKYESIYEKIRKASPDVETFEIFPAFHPTACEFQ